MKQLLYRGLQAYTNPLAKRFYTALAEPQAVQERVLATLVSGISKTDYGLHHGIKTISDFKTKCPIITYEDIADWMNRQRESEKNVLVPGKVSFYEKTSGSTGPQKYIPYTKALRQSFTQMFLLWSNDLVKNVPELAKGKLYFSVSPNFDRERITEQGVPVGLDDDADYLGGLWRTLLSPFLHLDPGLGKITDPEAFKQALAFSLIQCEDLAAISVWNPSFLVVIMHWIESHRDVVYEQLGAVLNQRQISALQKDPIDWQQLWPKLALISCWADGNAEPMADKLKAQFPSIYVQGKGLLSTEAPMTIPLVGVNGGVPLVEQTYFEFLNDSGDLLTLDQLELGQRYEIVISQQAGLSRYRMGDEVEVVDRLMRTPTLKFIGRNNRTSDLVGEKLNEAFVGAVIKTLPLKNIGFRALMATRMPEDGYFLVLDQAPDHAAKVIEELEQGLQQAYHYRHARALGQLAQVGLVVIPDIENILSSYRIQRGKTLGDMKQNYLILEDEAPDSVQALMTQRGVQAC